ncbi:MAG: ParB/RepB/Spo0J family partition protein [Hyphomonadaceae bacterium]
MTDITMIALSKLVPGQRNVRKTKPAMSIDELAASIAAHGLLQNLVVSEADKGRYSVEAGGRRLKALRKLAKAKTIPGNEPIPCRVVPLDDATEVSLAENVQREPMHPADEIEAFAQLAEAGHGPEAIAGRFGVNGTHVARRLRLARLSPRLIEALKKDEVDLDQLGALAFTDDHALQEKAFFDAPEWQRTPDQLKARVTQAHVAETDKLARFVGVDAYVEAGGAVASDLFADEDETRFLADRELLVRLAEAKLEPIVTEVQAEGWAFVEISIDGVAWSQFPERVRERRRDLTTDEAAEQERLYAKLDETEDEAEIEKIEAAIDALAPAQWDEDEVALAGAIVTLSHSGDIKVERGLVRVEDVKALRALRRKRTTSDHGGADADAEPAAAPKPAVPAKLLDELLAHKTLGLRVAIIDSPALALRLVTFSLAASFMGDASASCLAIAVDHVDVGRSITRAESKAAEEFAEIGAVWRSRLPANPEELWAYVSSMDEPMLLELIAVTIAAGIDLRRVGPLSGVEARHALGQTLCDRAGLDMTKYWKASVESYFEHVRKDAVVEALMEANPKLDRAALEKAPKKELLTRAKRAFKQGPWLPSPLRTSAAAAPLAIAAE